MDKVIIGIHGLANKPEADVLKEYWQKSIEEGLRKNQGYKNDLPKFDMLYWAHYMYSNPLHRIDNFSYDMLYNDEPYVEAKDKLVEYRDGYKDELRRIIGDTLGDLLDKAKANYGMDGIADFVLRKKLQDLSLYYNNKMLCNDDKGQTPAKELLRGTLINKIKEHQGKQIILIAHSMGSIIAHDALHILGSSGEAQVSDFITIGSPLGLPHVVAKAVDEFGYKQPMVPSSITRSWTNFADRKDPVALDTHLSDDYQASDKVTIKDDLVMNSYHAPENPEKKNHHKSYGYLRTPEFSRLMIELISS